MNFEFMTNFMSLDGKVIAKYADLYQESFSLKCRKNVVKPV